MDLTQPELSIAVTAIQIVLQAALEDLEDGLKEAVISVVPLSDLRDSIIDDFNKITTALVACQKFEAGITSPAKRATVSLANREIEGKLREYVDIARNLGITDDEIRTGSSE